MSLARSKRALPALALVFVVLGVLLLIVSFMYQRLKKILLSDEAVVPVNPTETP